VTTSLAHLNTASRDDFVAVCGPLFEHSPWIAERTYTQRPFATVDALHAALVATMYAATTDEQVKLIASHPDLVGRLAKEGRLTNESTTEQAAAGLTGLTDDEITAFDRYNASYREKFAFPFVICARQNKKDAILSAFPTRLHNSRDQEIQTSLVEIAKIASLRLIDKVTDQPETPMATLSYNSYGKSAVRLTKVVRNGPLHELFEIEAEVLLEGDFTAAYTEGDNTRIIATDTIKNTVYVLAKEKPFSSTEEFAAILARHFIKTYPHVSAAKVTLLQAIWKRIDVDGKPHDHAFTSGGPQKRYAQAVLDRTHEQPSIKGGVRGLLVLKTTASEWRDFHTDRYRTLKDTTDRIMASQVDADWHFISANADFNAASDAITNAILSTFATQHSLGVQQTILDMGNAALAASSAISEIRFELPNLHRIPFNLEPFGLKFENDIYVATDEPHGRIVGVVTRK